MYLVTRYRIVQILGVALMYFNVCTHNYFDFRAQQQVNDSGPYSFTLEPMSAYFISLVTTEFGHSHTTFLYAGRHLSHFIVKYILGLKDCSRY